MRERRGGRSQGVYLPSGTVQLKLQLDPFLGSPAPTIGPINPQQGIFSPSQGQTQMVRSQYNGSSLVVSLIIYHYVVQCMEVGLHISLWKSLIKGKYMTKPSGNFIPTYKLCRDCIFFMGLPVIYSNCSTMP